MSSIVARARARGGRAKEGDGANDKDDAEFDKLAGVKKAELEFLPLSNCSNLTSSRLPVGLTDSSLKSCTLRNQRSRYRRRRETHRPALDRVILQLLATSHAKEEKEMSSLLVSRYFRRQLLVLRTNSFNCNATCSGNVAAHTRHSDDSDASSGSLLAKHCLNRVK